MQTRTLTCCGWLGWTLRFSSLMVTIDIGVGGLRNSCAPQVRFMPHKVS